MNQENQLTIKMVSSDIATDPNVELAGIFTAQEAVSGTLPEQIDAHTREVRIFIERGTSYAENGSPSLNYLFQHSISILEMEKSINWFIKTGQKVFFNFEKYCAGFKPLYEHMELPTNQVNTESIKSYFTPQKSVQYSFPNPKSWSDLSIDVVENEMIDIRVNGGEPERIHFTSLGLIDKRVGGPSSSWRYLLKFAEYNGIIALQAAGMNDIQQHISRLRRSLKDAFELSENPIVRQGKRTYQTQFKIRDSRPQGSDTYSDHSV